MTARAFLWSALALNLVILAARAQTTAPAQDATTAPATSAPATAAAVPAPGIPSKDLRELAAKLSADLLQCNDIVRNPNRVTIVMKEFSNKTEDMPGRDMNIYAAKFTSLLNTGATADRMLVVEEIRALAAMQAAENGAPAPADRGGGETKVPRLAPQYALFGEVRSMTTAGTTHYLLAFRLTKLTTGEQIWQGSYEVQTLN